MTEEDKSKLGAIGARKVDLINARNDINDFMKTLSNLDPSREVSLAKTKAQECKMWLEEELKDLNRQEASIISP